MYGCFSFCFLVCKSNILANRTNIFRDKTSFHQFLTWLLPGLKKDQDRMVLTADKGVSLVVMDREEYERKSEDLLNQPTHRVLPSDPTTKQKNKLIAILKNIKSEGGINDNTYRKLYPTGASTPKYYGLPKVHKRDVP